MNLEQVSLDQLRAFTTVIDAGSFSAAAKQLHRATSAVSYSIRMLEEACGLQVFDRSSHRASLTAAGERLAVEARAVLASVQRLGQVARQLGAGFEARVVAVVDGVLPLAPVMSAVRRFSEGHDTQRVELRIDYLEGVQKRFEAEDADFMIALEGSYARSGDGSPNRYVATTLPAIELLLCVSASHVLAQQTHRKRWDEMATHVEVMVAASSANFVQSIGGPSRVVLGDFTAKREAIECGVGFGWLPRHLADEGLREKRLAIVPFEGGFRKRLRPELVHRSDRPLGQGASELQALLREELTKRVRRGRLL